MGINAAVGRTSPETFYHSPYMTDDGGALLRLNMDGSWVLVVGGGKRGKKVQGKGGGWRSGQWLRVQVQVHDAVSSRSPTVSVTVDGQQLAKGVGVGKGKLSGGPAWIGCGLHHCSFDNYTISR